VPTYLEGPYHSGYRRHYGLPSPGGDPDPAWVWLLAVATLWLIVQAVGAYAIYEVRW
jgi:hypothetical protein